MTNEVKYNSEMFKPELQFFASSMKKEDFKTANILANRIMTNAWLFDNMFLGISGFHLRQFATDALTASNVNNTTAIKQIIDKSEHYTNFVLGQISSEKNELHQLWTTFHIQRERYRKSLLLLDEKDVYDANPDFTKSVFHKTMKIFNDCKNDVTILSNNLVKGILNELNRTARTYGTKIDEIYLLSLIVMLERVDDYVALTAVDKDDFVTRTTDEVIPNITEIIEKYETGFDPNSTSILLWKLIQIWRKQYVRFLEPRSNVQPKSQSHPQEKAKEEIIDEFVEGIGEELVKK